MKTLRGRENRFLAVEDKLQDREIHCRKIKARVKVKFKMKSDFFVT